MDTIGSYLYVRASIYVRLTLCDIHCATYTVRRSARTPVCAYTAYHVLLYTCTHTHTHTHQACILRYTTCMALR